MKYKYLDDLKDIKEIMNRSSRFISLSGMSGIVAGLAGLALAYYAYKNIFTESEVISLTQSNIADNSIQQILIASTITLIFAISTSIIFTTRETSKSNETTWSPSTKRLVWNLFIPLATGGLLCLMLLLEGFVGIILPLSLIFYGLALINASKFTLPEVKTLGIIEVVLGLVAVQFMNMH